MTTKVCMWIKNGLWWQAGFEAFMQGDAIPSYATQEQREKFERGYAAAQHEAKGSLGGEQ